MRVDRTDVPTDMLIEFSFERLETPFVDFDPVGDPDLETMSRFVEAILQGEIDEAVELTDAPPGTSPDDSRELLQAFSGLLGDASQLLQLDRVVHLGSDRLLLWSIPVDNGQDYYRSFRFVRNPESAELRYEGVATEPISSLLTYTFQVGQESGPDPRSPEEFEYDYTIPATEEQPARFRFDGVELEIDAFNPLGETGYPPLDYFNSAMELLSNGSADDYAELYSQFSEGRYAAWAAEQGTEAYEAYRSDMIEHGARVVFLLEADPLYLVFHLPTNPAVTGSPLRYTAIYDNPESGLELTNFYVHGLADTVLQRREYFEEPFLRPLLAANGVIPAQPQAEGVVASAGEPDLPDPREMAANMEEVARDMEEEQPPSDIEDLARDTSYWPWILGAILLIAIVLTALARRK